MTETLVQAYAPLLFWVGLGLISLRFLPDTLPRWLGRSLYWVGIPLEIFALARQTHFSQEISLAPLITLASLLGGLFFSALMLWGLPKLGMRLKDKDWDIIGRLTSHNRAEQGSFILASMLGNTGFVGLAIAPAFVSDPYLSWVVFYGVTQNVIGTYGMGVFLASYFGRSQHHNSWWLQLRDVLTVPSLWAFTLGIMTRSIPLPEPVESGLHGSIWLVIPVALLLMGMRLSQLRGWKSLHQAVVPSILKVMVVPAWVGLVTTLVGLPDMPRLALVLMSGMPTAFAGLILAEEYDLDRELIASSILLTTVLLLLTVPLWVAIF